MGLKYKNYSLNSIFGLAAIMIFSIFTLIAFVLYPASFNPINEWLSNLGNINLNPLGSYFFNIGCIITGIFLIIFFSGIYDWKPVKIWDKILLIIGMILGIISSISLIMVGIFPETHIQQHLIAAAGVFGLMFIIILVINLALFYNPKFVRIVAYFGFLVIILDLIFQFLLSSYQNILGNITPSVPIPGLEWISAFASLVWIGFLAFNMLIKKI